MDEGSGSGSDRTRPPLDPNEPAAVSEARGLREAYERGVARAGHTEVGRIVGADWRLPELALKRVLESAAGG